MNRIYKVIWSKVSNQYVVVSELARRYTKHSGSATGAVRKAGVLLAALALTVGVSGMTVDAATNGSWTTATDANGNFTAHIDTANTFGQYAKNNEVVGDGNTVNTSSNKVTGDNNTVGTSTGNDTIIGDSNELTGLDSSWLIGSKNKLVGGTESLIFGNKNTSDRRVYKSILIGHNSKVTNGIDNTVGIGNNMEFGKNSDDSVVIGYGAKNGPFPTETPNYWPGSNGSVVIGKGAINESPYSVVIGSGAKMGNTINSSGRGIVIGTSVSIGDQAENSIAIGTDGTRVDDETDWTVAMGTNIKVGKSSDHSIAIGGVSASIGNDAPHSAAIGSFSKVYDGTWFGSAIGYSAKVNGRSSIALGHEARIGTDEKISRYAVALGYQSKVGGSAENGIAIGNGATVKDGAQSGLAIGVGAKANSMSSLAIGSGANATGSDNFAIGTGAKVSTKPGNISWSVAMGYYTTVEGGYSVALGSQAVIASGADRSAVVGQSSTVNSESGTIIGANATIGTSSRNSFVAGREASVADNAMFGTAVGSKAKVASQFGTAIGGSTEIEANTKHSVALGGYSKVKVTNLFTSNDLKTFKINLGTFYNDKWNISSGDGNYGVVSVGQDSQYYKRRIINVAKGRISSDSYDAINGQQIYHLTNDLTDQIAAAGGSVLAGTNIASVDSGTDADGKKQYTVNAKGASVSADDNFVLTSKEDATTNVTDYNLKLNDIVTIGAGTDGNNPIKIDGTKGHITGLTNKTLDLDDFAKVGRAATEEQLSAAMSDIEQKSYKGWKVSANGKDGVAVASNDTVDFSGKEVDGHKNIVVAQDATNLTFDLNTSINVGTGDNKVTIDGDNAKIAVGTGDNKVAIDGTKATVNVGANVSIDGQAGTANIGKVNVDGATGEIKGLTNIKLDGKDFATVGRAATEEQLNAAITDIKNSAYTGWNISANEENESKVDKDTTIDFGGHMDAEGNQNVFVRKDNAKLKFGLNNKITIGEGSTKAVINGEAGTFNLGTEEGKAVSLNGTTGMGEVGVIALNGADGEVTGLTNTTLVAEDFATVGRAATEEQLQGVNQQVVNNTNAIINVGNKVNELDNRIDKVGAGAAALAALHPLDFDPDDKWDITAGYGNYRGENAMALGAFYRPNEDTMFSVGSTMGNGNTMFNAGVSIKVGQGNHISTSRVAMAKEIKDLRTELEALKSAMLDSNAGRKVDTSKLQLFPDVPQNHWAYEYVSVLAGNGMIKGNPDGNFDGNRPLTRYEFAQMLYEAMVNGATLSDKILTEFAPELERFTVDTIRTDKNGNPTIERVRVKKQ
ncbi:MAG: S-layer homology domain-containing protein [Veillonella sp.]|uniref:ESPR-type extended signal peptide-containing protein n=1 Tax=Veillonella sp. TaxID=1926307 RepID=UPI002600F05D|nr:ESPR-type extended signal peptide-containing protein [Veillonella sp.]MBS4913926.1 S-layer homology domain-containing protein [Veillonella sp.]